MADNPERHLLVWPIWLAIGYVIAGIICCVLIVTIPFGIASFEDRRLRALWPFGQDRRGATPTRGRDVDHRNRRLAGLRGWWLALGHVITAIPLFVSIIGIPLGVANIKMIPSPPAPRRAYRRNLTRDGIVTGRRGK
ncbi:YccF domain-containing protein [Nonomuraea dietziae]|uniref:YccF domain-containing protein n=1 Tax=Nonomuraea dietziae TaxID=65515 RepID=UPI0031D820E4